MTSTVDEPKTAQTSEQEVNSESEHPPPSEEEKQTLRKVAGSLPLVSFSLCLVEFAERASYYGAKTVFSNFVQFPLPEGKYSPKHSKQVLLTPVKVEMVLVLLLVARKKLLAL